MQTREINQSLLDNYSDDVPYFLKRIYAARNVTENDLDLSLQNLLKPTFKNLEVALNRLEIAIREQQNILIVGDFDCDGATASVVGIKSLRMMGAVNVDFLVPNRFEHGYGLSPEIVKIAIDEKQPDLIITVDNGISSFTGVELANENNIDVIITDHHLAPKKLPNALAIINPNLKDCSFESKNLAGVGVCFYLMSALKTHLKQKQYFETNQITEPNLSTVLDLVALGTIADVVKLDKNNRILIQAGLQRIRAKKCSAGIIALFEIAKKPINTAVASDIAFGIAPRLNAAGRMSDISYGIRCLLCDDLNLARKYAQELETLNQERRDEQQRMQEQADDIIHQKFADFDFNDFSICLFDKSWHEGIVGIVAGKLKEKYQVPSVVFASSNDDFLKGSIRSIPDVHIKDLLDLLNRDNPNIIEKFGGHAMAAGLVIKTENFEKFSLAFETGIKNWLANKKPQLTLLTDGELESAEICFENAQKLKNAGPWGQGFEEPIYQGTFKIVEQNIIGEKHLRLYLKTLDDGQVLNAIAFNQTPFIEDKITIAYQLNINDFRGNQSLQLMIKN
jgi:single-stranded-DNA-specific exonuclease